jgi:hypothetical protein
MSQTNNNSLLITPTTQFNCGLDHGTNEFAIIGDDLVIESQNSVPDWFINIIGDTINGNLEDLYNNMYNYNYNLLQSLEQIEVAKNTYAQYISKVITDESAYVAALTTLNASIADSDATIRQLLSTYATRDFAVASAAQLLTAEINGGSISAKIGSVESAMATQYGAMAQRLNQLSSEFDSQSELGNANANAIELLTTYTGLGTVNGLPAVIANSNFYRQLDAYLEGTNYGDVGGTSNLIQDVTAISTEAASSVEAKFEYGSTITLDGISYRAGFGLVQTGTVSSDGTTYDSEFWIDANKLRFTNSNRTGSVDPFTIDASGSTPQITFNGNVVINNRATALDGEGLAKFHGNLSSAPTGELVEGDSYYNTNQAMMYTYDGSKWVASARQTQVTGIAFIRSTSQPATPTGGSYVSPTPTTSGWSDGIPSGTGAIWWSSRIFTSDGLNPQDGAWGTPVQAVNTQYTEYQYSTSASGPWQSTAFDGAVYARTRTNNNGVWSGWATYRIKGEQGIAGTNGTTGSRGTGFGTSSASSASDSAFTAATGLSPAIDGDQLLLTNSSGSMFYKRQNGRWVNNAALQVDGNAIINGMALVKGKLLTGNGIESSLYSPGSKGWRISADGTAEFNSLSVRVPISNVTGSITKGQFANVSPYGQPVNRGGSPGAYNYARQSLYVMPPVAGKNYSILVYASIVCGDVGGDSADLEVRLELDGAQVAANSGSSPWNISVTALGLFNGQSGSKTLRLKTGGYNSRGTIRGQFGYVVFPE